MLSIPYAFFNYKNRRIIAFYGKLAKQIKIKRCAESLSKIDFWRLLTIFYSLNLWICIRTYTKAPISNKRLRICSSKTNFYFGRLDDIFSPSCVKNEKREIKLPLHFACLNKIKVKYKHDNIISIYILFL